ncbi:MAG: GNAT family N-acetyltransferase [Pseudomonadota bacterium]
MNAAISKPVLKTERLVLRAIEVSDAQVMFEAGGDAELNRLTGTHSRHSLKEIQSHCARIAEAPDRLDYVLCVDGNAIGEIVLSEISFDNQSAFLRIAIWRSDLRGQGFGGEALQCFLGFAFRTLQLNRIDLDVYDFNERAIRLYQKAGFRREGVKRSALRWNGVYFDAYLMSILRDDFERLPGAGMIAEHGHIGLRRLDPRGDTNALHAIFGDPASCRYLPDPATLNLDETRARLTAWLSAAPEHDWTIVDQTDATVLGRVTLFETVQSDWEVAIMICPDARGRGIAHRALQLAIDNVDRTSAPRRIFADIDPENIVCIRLFEQLGFTFEGVLRSAYDTHIGVRDAYLMSLIHSDTRRWRSDKSSQRSSGLRSERRPPSRTR